jgi:hypothetical protein
VARTQVALPATLHVAGPVEQEGGYGVQRCLRCDTKLPPPGATCWPVGSMIRERLVRVGDDAYSTEYMGLRRRRRTPHPDEAHCVADRA